MTITVAGQATFGIDGILYELEVDAAPSWDGAPLRFHPEELDAAFARWVFAHGTFGCLVHSHMWNCRWNGNRKPASALVDGQQHTESKKTRPYRPQTNGKIERFHRTLADGWAYARLYLSEAARREALPGWLHSYNHHRHHSAIGAPPISRIENNLPGHHT